MSHSAAQLQQQRAQGMVVQECAAIEAGCWLCCLQVHMLQQQQLAAPHQLLHLQGLLRSPRWQPRSRQQEACLALAAQCACQHPSRQVGAHVKAILLSLFAAARTVCSCGFCAGALMQAPPTCMVALISGLSSASFGVDCCLRHVTAVEEPAAKPADRDAAQRKAEKEAEAAKR